MHKLKYCPLQSGYTAQIGDGVISQELDGGAPRFRRALKSTYHAVNVQWVVKEAGYQYLMAFYRVWAKDSSQRFLASLCIDKADVEDYQCYFSEPPTLSSKEADIYTVSATLRVKPLNIDKATDDNLVGATNDSLSSIHYQPLQNGYTAKIGNGVTFQELGGGAPRYRKAPKGTHHEVNVQWVVRDGGYQYLMAFYRTWARNPSKQFLVKLCVDNATVEDYQCYFSGPPSLTSKEANIYTVSATLRVRPLSVDKDMDDVLVGIGNNNESINDVFNPLEELVNESLPDALVVL